MSTSLTARIVAARYLQPRRVLASVDFSAFRRLKQQFADEVAPFLSGRQPVDVRSHVFLQRRWEEFVPDIGADVARWVVETRAIPKGKAKALELAARLFLAARRAPRDVVAWWEKNERHITLLEEAIGWPEKEAGDEKFEAGPFTMHNTLHLAGDDLVATREVAEKAASLIRKAGFGQILYGDVFVVGRLDQSDTLAWYYLQEDTVYVRPHLKVGLGDLHYFIHELAHRHWYKFLGGSQKGLWESRYAQVNVVERYVRPRKGEPLPVDFNKLKTKKKLADAQRPTVEDFGLGYLILDNDIAVLEKEVEGLFYDEQVIAKFPTPYSSTSAEEYYAEAFALYARDKLEEPHLTWFREVTGR